MLLAQAHSLPELDEALAARLTPEVLTGIVGLIPDDWLGDVPELGDVAAHRAAYVDYLTRRLDAPRAFVQEAWNAHRQL